MAKATRLEQLMDAPGAPLVNWRDIIQEIDNEFPDAETEEKRVALLALFSLIRPTFTIVTGAITGLPVFLSVRYFVRRMGSPQ